MDKMQIIKELRKLDDELKEIEGKTKVVPYYLRYKYQGLVRKIKDFRATLLTIGK